MSKFLLKFSLLTLIFFYLLLTQKYFVINRQIFLQNKKPILKNLPRNSVFVPETLNVEQIFADDHYWVATFSAEKLTTIITTGDVMLGRAVNYQNIRRHNFNWPYLKTAEVIKKADVTFINLETPLIDNCPITQEGMIFCGDEKNIEGLVFAGVDIANLANNHASNYGLPEIEKTINLLEKNKILVTGTESLVIKEIRGIKFAFLGYNDVSKPQVGITNVEEKRIKSEITEAKKKADVVIIAFHWGLEYQSQPSERQKYLGHLAVDSGADLVIGNHPHWIQPIEIYKEKLIVYSHGNFIFDQLWSKETKEGVIGEYTFYKEKLIDVNFLPIVINDSFQPFLAEEVEARKILNQMRETSLGLK